MTGRVFEIREFTLQDGPGIRTTVFFKGCPLRCAWCHNPEGQSSEVEFMTRPSGEKVRCGADWTAEALATELLRNADIMSASGGGITFSGGEPLMQAEFLLSLIDAIRSRPESKGIGLAVETSGYCSQSTYAAVVSRLDFVYQDLKHHSAADFRKWTGGDLGIVLENLAWLRTSGIAYHIRVPLIPGVNDAPADRAALEALIGNSPVEWLPYNAAAGAKYPLLGRTYPLAAEC